ncbi:MAG: DUF255 domain-containing protein [Myxococcaceae bacterium]
MLTALLASLVFAQVRDGTLDSENIAKARELGRVQAFEWLEYGPAAFARAKAEQKVVLVDCAAEWCHWCHVMDETTYRDPEVGAWLAKNAIAVRVDVDARPDLADRYADWGWPATVLLSGDGEELGKFRGYLPPERMRSILTTLDRTAVQSSAELPLATEKDVPAAVKFALSRLEFFWDAKQGGWGTKRKTPIGMNVTWELTRGTKASIARADFTLGKQRALIDPVWGGLSQYSASSDWSEPHFEKLLAYQAANLEAWARGYEVTKKPQHLADARKVFAYVTEFLRAKDGTFFVNQDADLNAHEPKKAFVDGHTYYALDDAGRRALGIPWIDTHVYAGENGKWLVALAAFARVEPKALETARMAADRLLVTHVGADGAVVREAGSKAPPMLEDAAWLGLGLARLAEVTGDAKYRAAAEKIAERLLVTFHDDATGALVEHAVDADAVGVFARRTHPFGPNVAAARLLGALGKVAEGRRVLGGVSSKERVENEWAWVGDYLQAARELAGKNSSEGKR